mgnify:CR=1 FL=1
MASIFSRIVAGEIPCYKVAETEKFLAFLDVNPIAEGHVLCIPKEEIDYVFDIEDALYNELFLFAKKVALGMKKVCPCIKIGMSVIGIDVPHTHIHLVPINKPSDMDFTTHVKMEKEEMVALSEKIAKSVEALL